MAVDAGPHPSGAGGSPARWRRAATPAALLGCLAVLPVTLSRLTGGDAFHLVPLLAAVSPFAVPALLLALVLALAGRRRVVAAVPALLLAPHLAWVAPSLVPDGGPPGGGSASAVRITVMTSNVLYGRGDAAAVVDAVAAHGVDVLAVEELTPAVVTRLRAAGLERLLPHAVLAPRSATDGTGLWSRLPLRALPEVAGTTFRHPRARAELPGGGSVTVTAAHPFPPLRREGIARWQADLAALTDAVSSTDGAQVVAGDLNATRDHAPFRRLLDAGLTDAADAVGAPAWPGLTWPADRAFPPVMRLDHVLVSPQISVDDVTLVTIPGSDHRAVVARLAVSR